MKTAEPRRAYSVSETASIAGVSTKTVRRWIAAGHLPAERIGTTVRVAAADLDRMFPPINSPSTR